VANASARRESRQVKSIASGQATQGAGSVKYVNSWLAGLYNCPSAVRSFNNNAATLRVAALPDASLARLVASDRRLLYCSMQRVCRQPVPPAYGNVGSQDRQRLPAYRRLPGAIEVPAGRTGAGTDGQWHWPRLKGQQESSQSDAAGHLRARAPTMPPLPCWRRPQTR
jgi:hypothetical protein